MKRVYIYIVIALCGVSACTSSRQRILEDTRLSLVDKHATDLTAILFHNLKQMTGKYVVYGQHNYEMDVIRIPAVGVMNRIVVMLMM